jgi:hypothetical protein
MKPLSDEKLRSYFLGKLPESEADALEMECAISEELTSQAQMVERELADDYLRGNLTSVETNLFETNYLISESRHKKVRAAQSLWEIANEPKVEKSLPIPPTANASWKGFFGQRKTFQLAFTCLLLLFAFGAIAVYLLTLSVGKEEVAEVKDVKEANYATPKVEVPPMPNDVADTQTPKVGPANTVIHPKEIDKELPLPEKSPIETKPLVKPTVKSETKISKAPSFATFLLFSEALRSEGEQSIKIATGINQVNLLLNLPGESKVYKTYRVSVKTADGDAVYTSPNLKSLSFSLPAEKLENRTYMIFLEGQNASGEFDSITEYTFRAYH